MLKLAPSLDKISHSFPLTLSLIRHTHIQTTTHKLSQISLTFNSRTPRTPRTHTHRSSYFQASKAWIKWRKPSSIILIHQEHISLKHNSFPRDSTALSLLDLANYILKSSRNQVSFISPLLTCFRSCKPGRIACKYDEKILVIMLLKCYKSILKMDYMFIGFKIHLYVWL